ncbi:unnamed protein product [Darwinula stevensoni]|uniref:Uncharacterized protein n=1 Tax=Darwinula stevensoni TaxID=69355 RepID=A0A7R8XAN1_9CRUS|nr:unnamed protein product [Darwinula stevensoni]CAG0892052.1 unnamed protein product [Darwinula stevensoni]
MDNLRKAGCHHFYREGCVGPGEVPELIVEADDDICFCGTNLCNAAAGCGTAIVLFFLSAVSSLLSPQ